MKQIVYLIVLGLCIYIGYEFFRVHALAAKSATLVAETHAYQKPQGLISILVLGDSTAVGVGASAPEQSVAGLLGESLHASIENHAVSGAVTADMIGQLHDARRHHYDLILIQVGANDVVGIGALGSVEAMMQTLLDEAVGYSNRVVVLTGGRIGDAPIFPLIFRAFVNGRAAALRTSFITTVASGNSAVYIDLTGAVSDAFARDPSTYYAVDMFHPSSAGYSTWFDVLKLTIMHEWPGLKYGG